MRLVALSFQKQELSKLPLLSACESHIETLNFMKNVAHFMKLDGVVKAPVFHIDELGLL